MTTIQQALASARQQLDRTSDSPQADAEYLLCHVLACPRSHLYTWPEKQLDAGLQHHFEQLLQRRLQGEPIAYLTGRRAFWEFELRVSDATLIPRAETELLVEQALARIAPGHAANILDLGTGSGAIAIAIAQQRPDCQLTAVERSRDAFTIASDNVAQLQLHNVNLKQGDWFRPVQGQRFDMIVSNPPYIAEHDPHLQQGDVRFEPRSALVAGSDGLDAIRTIIAQAGDYLRPAGWLLLEHGHDQAGPVKSLFLKHGFIETGLSRDLAGLARVSFGQWPGDQQLD